MSDYEVTETKCVYDGTLSSVRIDTVRMPDGTTAEREIIEHVDAVATVPLADDDRVLLLRQYRPAVRGRLLELPAGILDVDGEEPEEAARRELAEEAGLSATALQRMVTFSNSAGWSEETTTIYLATGLREATTPQDFVAEHEETDMELVWVPLAEAAAMATRGDITDAKTLIGILLTAARRGVDLRQ